MKPLFLALIILPFLLLAQDHAKVDSLEIIIKETEDDSTKAQLLFKIGKVYDENLDTIAFGK